MTMTELKVAIIVVAGLAVIFVVPIILLIMDALPDEEDPIQMAAVITKKYESLVLTPYHDPEGYPHVGYGHKLSDTPWAPLDQFDAITEAQADSLLRNDLAQAQEAVSNAITRPLEAHQEAALIDLAFNIGGGAFGESTLVKRFNEGDPGDVPAEFLRWVYSRGERLPGLENRREAEVDLWEERGGR